MCVRFARVHTDTQNQFSEGFGKMEIIKRLLAQPALLHNTAITSRCGEANAKEVEREVQSMPACFHTSKTFKDDVLF